MLTKKEEALMIEGFVKLINYVGDAGINDVEGFNYNNEQSPYYINLQRENGEGYQYNYYDYKLYIGSRDGRNLEITTTALENNNKNNYRHATKVLVSYLLPNDKRYGVSIIINGWDYNNMIKLKTNDYKEKAKRVIDDDVYTTLIPRNIKPFIFKPDEVESFINIIEKLIEIDVEYQVERDNKIKEILNSLTNDEIKVLKKKLIQGKY